MAHAPVLHNVSMRSQALENACWYTCYDVVVEYQRGRGRGGSLRRPSEVKYTADLFAANQGVGATNQSEKSLVASLLGFTVQEVSPTAEGIWSWIGQAPILFDGCWPGQSSGHCVTIVGMSEANIAVYDPIYGLLQRDYNQFMTSYLQLDEFGMFITP